MKKQCFIYFLGIAAVLTACRDKQATTDSTSNQGKVKQETVAVAPKLAGRILEIFVKEGQSVNAGDTLALLDIPELSSKLQQASGAIESAEGQLSLAVNGASAEQVQQVQGQIDAATAQLDFANESNRRMKNMFDDSLISAQQYDEVHSKYLAAKAQLAALQARKTEIVKGTRPETIQSARGQVERAVGAKNEVLQAQKEIYLTAPADMVIESITLKKGELALPGYTLFNGYQLEGTYFRFTIPESKINGYQVNQSLQVTVPFTHKVIPVTVASIKQLPRYAENTSTAPNYQLGEGLFEIKLVPVNTKEAEGLFANSTVLLADK
jgi:HlyD family secretion protein